LLSNQPHTAQNMACLTARWNTTADADEAWVFRECVLVLLPSTLDIDWALTDLKTQF
jgi:hypothetical protein